jgi:CRISPR-associated endoribonuclease Cas6
MSALGKKGQQFMPFNYHYPLSSAIHNAIRKSDGQFASFFHEVGYGFERFKLFTFSDITIPFASKGDRMLLLNENGSFKVCFHMPAAAEHFIKGLFINQELMIGDTISQVRFRIQDINNCLHDILASPDEVISVIVQPISPLVVSGRRVEKSVPVRYFSPYELLFADRLIFSWIQKYKAISPMTDIEITELRKQIKVDILFLTNPPTERRIIIKDGQDAAQKVRGYTKFRLRLTAPKSLIDLALNSGLGIKNSMGMGCIQLIN